MISNDLSSDILDSVNAHIFYQYLFYAQLNKLRTYARSCSVEIMGDAPIFVSMDSADVWANPELFQLNDKKKKVDRDIQGYIGIGGQTPIRVQI